MLVCCWLSVKRSANQTDWTCWCIRFTRWFLHSLVLKLDGPNLFTRLLCMLYFLWWVSACCWLWRWWCWCCCCASGGATKVSLFFLTHICYTHAHVCTVQDGHGAKIFQEISGLVLRNCIFVSFASSRERKFTCSLIHEPLLQQNCRFNSVSLLLNNPSWVGCVSSISRMGIFYVLGECVNYDITKSQVTQISKRWAAYLSRASVSAVLSSAVKCLTFVTSDVQ